MWNDNEPAAWWGNVTLWRYVRGFAILVGAVAMILGAVAAVGGAEERSVFEILRGVAYVVAGAVVACMAAGTP